MRLVSRCCCVIVLAELLMAFAAYRHTPAPAAAAAAAVPSMLPPNPPPPPRADQPAAGPNRTHWVPGYWTMPSPEDWRWVPPHRVLVPSHWEWVAGYWAPGPRTARVLRFRPPTPRNGGSLF